MVDMGTVWKFDERWPTICVMIVLNIMKIIPQGAEGFSLQKRGRSSLLVGVDKRVQEVVAPF